MNNTRLPDDLKKKIDDIVDLFSGADGCVGFVTFLMALETVVDEAQKGNKAAISALDDISKFHRIATVFSRPRR